MVYSNLILLYVRKFQCLHDHMHIKELSSATLLNWKVGMMARPGLRLVAYALESATFRG
jgi:hypothetical protein